MGWWETSVFSSKHFSYGRRHLFTFFLNFTVSTVKYIICGYLISAILAIKAKSADIQVRQYLISITLTFK